MSTSNIVVSTDPSAIRNSLRCSFLLLVRNQEFAKRDTKTFYVMKDLYYLLKNCLDVDVATGQVRGPGDDNTDIAILDANSNHENRFWVATKGKVTGVFDDLTMAALATLGVSNNQWKAYSSRAEAEFAYDLALEQSKPLPKKELLPGGSTEANPILDTGSSDKHLMEDAEWISPHIE